MYEKAGQFEKSLMDITSVLALDMFHIKARTRRGRLFEAQVAFKLISFYAHLSRLVYRALDG